MAIRQSDRLPELEEATASLMSYDIDSSTFDMVFAWIVVLLPAIIISFYVLRSHSVMNLDVLKTIAVLQLLLITFTWRCYLGGFRWSTDRNGLTAWNIFGRRSVSWYDVNEITTGSVFLGLTSHILHTKQGIFRVPAKENTQLIALGASIYQNVRQYSSTCKLEIPAETQTVWVDIPEWIPREMSWTNPNPPNVRMLHLTRKLTLIPFILVSILCAYFSIKSGLNHTGYTAPPGFSLLITISGSIAIFGKYKIQDSEIISMHLKPDELEILEPSGVTLIARWVNIDSAQWGTDGKLELATERLPHNDQESQILLLGIIRALRERENPIILTIPNDLLAVIEKHNQQSQV